MPLNMKLSLVISVAAAATVYVVTRYVRRHRAVQTEPTEQDDRHDDRTKPECPYAKPVREFATRIVNIVQSIGSNTGNAKNSGYYPTSEGDITIYQHPEAEPGSWDRAFILVRTPRGNKAAYFDDGRDYVMDRDRFLTDAETLTEVQSAAESGYERIDTAKYRRCYGVYLEGENPANPSA